MNLELTNDTGTLTLPRLAPPLTTDTLEGVKEVETLDNNISSYFIANKRQWSHTWPYMSESDFNALKAYYDAQWTEFKYPLLSIDYYSISNVPVRMTLDPKSVIDNCGTVQDVTVTLRETRQLA